MKLLIGKPKNKQECIQYLKWQMKIFLLMLIIGIATIIFAVLTDIHFSEMNKWIYIGFGGGLIAASIKRILYNVRLCKDEKALKEYYVRISDEREIFISNKAFGMAVLSVIIISYVVALICSFFVPYIMYGLAGQVVILLISYVIFRSIYNKRG